MISLFSFLFIHALTGEILSKALVKKLGGENTNREGNLLVVFFICFLFSTVAFLISQEKIIFQSFVIIAIIGSINSFGAYCYWRAASISLLTTSIFMIGDDILSILLGVIFLDEYKFINGLLLIGIFFSLVGAVLIESRKAKPEKISKDKHIFIWIICCSLIWGTAIFSMRYFSFAEQTHSSSFLFSWYLGSSLGALILVLLQRKRSKLIHSLASYKILIFSPLLTFISLWSSIKAFSIAPILIVQPLFLVSEISCPLLLSIFYFKEHKSLNKIQIFGALLGVIGALLISYTAISK